MKRTDWIATYYNDNDEIELSIELNDMTEEEANKEAYFCLPYGLDDWSLIENLN